MKMYCGDPQYRPYTEGFLSYRPRSSLDDENAFDPILQCHDRIVRQSGWRWHQFYSQVGAHFYRDRHYLAHEFPELSPHDRSHLRSESNRSSTESSGYPVDHTGHASEEPAVCVLEAGCGAGSTLIPLAHLHPTWRFYAFDFASSAVELVKNRCTTECDPDTTFVIETGDLCGTLPSWMQPESGVRFDICMLMFVLSALPASHHLQALTSLVAPLQKGGHLLFRDYTVEDVRFRRFHQVSNLAELKPLESDEEHSSCDSISAWDPTKRIDERTFVRKEGTLAHFFEEEEIVCLFESCGLEINEIRYIDRQVSNRKLNKNMQRKWIQIRACKT